jgi:hypothetical protein
MNGAPMNPKPGFVNTRVGVYGVAGNYSRVTIELECPFTYTQAKEAAANALKIDVDCIRRVTFN